MRRIHVHKLAVGEVALPAGEAHHARNVLRLEAGAEVELFDDAGRVGRGVLSYPSADGAVARVMGVTESAGGGRRIVVASAVPKGERAEWMVEKLSELGVGAFVPLRTKRSVVHPEGANKYERWRRIATEAAKQSKRVGVMEIRELTELAALLLAKPRGWYFSTGAGAISVREVMGRGVTGEWVLFVGPEGGWTEEEVGGFEAAGVVGVSLGTTVLRVETAAVVGAGVVMAMTAVDAPGKTGG